MIKKFKLGFYHIAVFFKVYVAGYLPVYYFKNKTNFGDLVNIYIVESLSKKKVVWINPKYWPFKNYLVIGSILSEANSKSIIWGSGYISAKADESKPKKIYAVRGPRTAQRLIESGHDECKAFGDPALLLPELYNPKLVTKKYKVGIIPHYVDKSNDIVSKLKSNPQILVIDIEQPDPLKFIDELLSCESIYSSSLHGLIVSDAYNIPNQWIKFSNKVIGNDFKFYDYFNSVKRNNTACLRELDSLNFVEHSDTLNGSNIEIDKKLLLQACPFRSYK